MGNIYKVNVSGGVAAPVTTGSDYNSHPVWSHDGKTIAFASDKSGNFDVYTMSANGGVPMRLTYNSAADYPQDFTADNKFVLFNSPRNAPAKSVRFPSSRLFYNIYTVPVGGGRPILVSAAGMDVAHYNYAGTKIVFQDRKGYEDDYRKHHVSPVTRDIWIYNIPDNQYSKVTNFKGEDLAPVFASDDNSIYYTSEQDGTLNVYKRNVSSGTEMQMTHFKGFPVRDLSISANGTLAFVWKGDIYTMRDGSQPQKVAVAVADDAGYQASVVLPLNGVTEFEVSPNGKEVAFINRGELFVSGVKDARTKRITNTPWQERMICWSHNGKYLFFSAEREGKWGIYKVSLKDTTEKYFYASTLLNEEPVVVNDNDNFQPLCSPDNKKLAYVCERNVLKVMMFRSVKGGVLDIQAGAQNRFFGANDFYSLDYPDQAERTRTYLGSVKWDDNFGNNWSAKVIFSYRKNYDKFELFRDGKNATSWYQGPNYHDTDNFGFSAVAEHKGWLGGTTGVGFDYNYNHIYSNVLGENLTSSKKIAGVPGGYYTKGADRNVTNEWLRHVYGHGLISIPLSLNLVQSSYGGDFMWSGGVNVNFYPLITVSFSVTRSMRLPTYTDLYYTTATHEANADLNPEKATTYRIAMDFTGTNLRFAETGSATGGNYYDNFWNHFNAGYLFYYRDGSNIIDWVRAENETLWKSLQIGKVKARGTELSAEFVSWKFIKSVKAGYAHIHMNKKAEGYVSKTALDYLRDKVSLSGQFTLCKRIEADIFATWCDRVGGYYGAAVTKTYPYIDYKLFWKVDAAISFELVKKADMLANIYLKASNLFNERYYDCGGIRMPGTWISAGISITLF